MKSGRVCRVSPVACLTAVFLSAAFLAFTSAVFPQDGDQGVGNQDSGQASERTGINLDEARAQDEFRWAVEAFHAGRLNDAIFGLNRALAFQPTDVRSRNWLGRAYVRSGFPSAGLSEWNVLVESGEAPGYLLNQIETLEYQRGILDETPQFERFVQAETFVGARGEVRVFRRPAGLLPLENGSFYAVSVATQDIVLLNPNGTVLRRLRGGVLGLDVPYDVARLPDGTLVVSEYGADRIAVLNPRGDVIRRFGETGLGPGNLLGPQYVAVDDRGFVYVSEWGARRVSKFDPRGEFVAVIGRQSAGFRGLSRPTGVAVVGNVVYVADLRSGVPVLETFDLSGNWIETIEIPREDEQATFTVEDIWATGDRSLVLSMPFGAVVMDLEQQALLGRIESDDRTRVVSAAIDANGRLLATDFDADEIALFEPGTNLFSGLEVRIQRIVSRDFPRMGIEVRLTDRKGQPIVGLDETNFLVSERGRLIEEMELQSAGHATTALDISIVVDVRSFGADQTSSQRLIQAVQDALRQATPQDRVSVYLVGPQPQEVELYGESATVIESRLTEAVDRLYSSVENPRTVDALDRAIRLGIAARTVGDVRRAVVLVTDGYVADTDFQNHSLEELEAFMTTNEVRFGLIHVGRSVSSPALAYLADGTDGVSVQAFAPSGVLPLFDHLRSAPAGLYRLVYQSVIEPDFVTSFVTTSVEANLFTRSGRDELGYFAPPREE